MENQKRFRGWKKHMRALESERLLSWSRNAKSQESEEDRIQEEIEQNQYLWAEYIGDIGAG